MQVFHFSVADPVLASASADIRMTMRYVQVTQQDLQREFHRACHNTTLRHPVPKLPPVLDHRSTSLEYLIAPENGRTLAGQ